MLSAIQLVNIMKVTKKSLSELASEMKKFPQILQNVRVTDKHNVTSNEKVKNIIEEVEQEMGDNGRVLVRPSGTEPLVRVMVEAPTDKECKEYVDRIVKVVVDEMGLDA
jgi:phosphoglucosamine mutase